MRFSRLYVTPNRTPCRAARGPGFEGTISMKVSGDNPQTVNWSFKGPLASASIISAATSATPPAVSLIIDNAAHTSTNLMPFAASAGSASSGMNGIALTSPFSNAAGGATTKPGFKELGTSQTISGLKCDDYDLNDAAHTRACLTDALGTFAYPSMSMAMGGGMGGMAMPAGAQGFSMGGGDMPAGATAIRRNVQVLPNGAQIITTTSDVGSGTGGVMTSSAGAGGVGGDTTNVIQMATVDQNGTKNTMRIATAGDGSNREQQWPGSPRTPTRRLPEW